MNRLGVVFLFFMLPLFGGIEDYFKKAVNKSGSHSMRAIDFVYVINLDKRTEKYARTMDALEPFNITPYRFSAVNGWQLSHQALNDLGIIFQEGMAPGPIATVFRLDTDGKEYNSYEVMKEIGVAYYCHSLSRGAIGCLMSHLSILQDAYDSGYQTIWVMEDDIKIVRDPNEISVHVDTLNSETPNWDVLFTDCEIKGGDGKPVPCACIRPRPNFQVQPLQYYLNRTPLNSHMTKIGMRFGSASMVVNRSGMKKILDFFKTYKVYFPYDIDYFIVPGINLYMMNYDIVTNISGGESDVSAP